MSERFDAVVVGARCAGSPLATLLARRGLRLHIGGMGGSYIALITALLVVNVGEALPIVWFVPTIVGSPIIAWVINEVDTGRRPRVPLRSARARASA